MTKQELTKQQKQDALNYFVSTIDIFIEHRQHCQNRDFLLDMQTLFARIENWHGDQLRLEAMRAFTLKHGLQIPFGKYVFKNESDEFEEVEFKSSNSPQKFSIL